MSTTPSSRSTATPNRAGLGYSGVRGLNALLAAVSTTDAAPVVVAQRLRKASCGSPRGAARLVADALKTVASLSSAKVLVRADSAFYGRRLVGAAVRAGADVSVTVRMDKESRLRSPGSVTTRGRPSSTPTRSSTRHRRWVSRAEVAEVPFTAFTGKKKAEQVGGRLVVRRIPDLNPKPAPRPGDAVRHLAFPCLLHHPDPAVLDTVAADKTHRGHAIIEQVHADLKSPALAHLPSGKFAANAAWLVLAVIAFNLTRAAAALTGPGLAKATTATVRRKLITVPARLASSARRVTLHLPAPGPGNRLAATVRPGLRSTHRAPS